MIKWFFCSVVCGLAFFEARAVQTDSVIVSQDGTGNYHTIQEAIDAAPAHDSVPFRIYIKNGRYSERIIIPPDKPHLQLIGQSAAGTIITWDNYSGKPDPSGGFYHTSNSATFTVMATDLLFENITFENGTGLLGDGPQALAVNVAADRCIFCHCRFIGGQDTLLTWGNHTRQYFKDCYIDGNTDFIFGSATAVFDSCVIYPRDRIDGGSSGYITAANTPRGQPFGYVFRDCKILNNLGITSYRLGRPWQNDARYPDSLQKHNKVVFLNTSLPGSILPEGWSKWNAGTVTRFITFAEYNSHDYRGNPVDVSRRVSWSRQLTKKEALAYRNDVALFGDWDPDTILRSLPAPSLQALALANFRVRPAGAHVRNITWNLCWPEPDVSYSIFRSPDSLHFTRLDSFTITSDTMVAFRIQDTLYHDRNQPYYYYVEASGKGLPSTKSQIVKN